MPTTYYVTPLDAELFRESLFGLELEELRSLVTSCRECVLGYTPEMLRDAIGLSHAYATFLTGTFRELQELVDGDALDWAGFAEPMAPADWLGAMLYVAEAMSKDSPDFVHPLEIAYPAFLTRKAAAEGRRALRAAQNAPAPVEVAVVAVKNEASALAVEVGADTGEDLEVKIARIDAERKAAAAARRAEGDRRAAAMAARTGFVLVDENDMVASTPVQLVVVDGQERDLFMPVVTEGNMQLSHLVSRTAITTVGARSKARLRWYENNPRVIESVSGFAPNSIQIRYSGEELRTGDIETWSKLLELASRACDDKGNRLPMGKRITVYERELLLALNRGTGGTAFQTVRAERTRLQAAMLHIIATDAAFIAQMAQLFPEDETVQLAVEAGRLELRTHLLGGDSANGKSWTVEIPRLVRVMFGARFSSWIDEATYYSLKGDQARRLYMLYASHVNCYALSLPELKDFLGSTYRKESDFKEAMDRAHDELVARGVIQSWTFKQPDRRRLNACCYEVKRKFKPKKTTAAVTA